MNAENLKVLTESYQFLQTLLDSTTEEDAIDLLMNHGEDVSERLRLAINNLGGNISGEE